MAKKWKRETDIGWFLCEYVASDVPGYINITKKLIVLEQDKGRSNDWAEPGKVKKMKKQIHELCVEIEKMPASEQQTKVSIMASDLLKNLTPALESVLQERKKQDEKWGEQNHNPYIYLAIHMEEVGELAEAILHTQFGGPKGGWLNVRKEAVDAAATALALIECLDRDKWLVNDIEFNHPTGD